MSGEPEPAAAGGKLDKALVGLMIVWLGLTVGLGVVTAVLVGVQLFALDGPLIDFPALAYLFLLAVPLGLVGAFLLAPKLAREDPAAAGRRYTPAPGGSAWHGTPPDDPFYWFPVFQAEFFLRAGQERAIRIVDEMKGELGLDAVA